MKSLSSLLEREIDALPQAYRQRLHSLRIGFEEEQRGREIDWEILNGRMPGA